MATENKRNFSEEQVRKMRDADVGLQAGQNKGATQAGHGGMGNTRWGGERGLLTNHALVLNTTLPSQAHVIQGGTGGGSLVRTTSMCKGKMGDIGYYAHIQRQATAH